MARENPCLSCGACCAFFRVSFYWGETTEDPEGTVPAHLTEDITPFYRSMKGSNQKNPRCIALEGEIGHSVRCRIYDQRSSTCRNFAVDFKKGQVIANPDDYERCIHARAHWGLPPIQVDVFQTAENIFPQSTPWPLTPHKKQRKKRNSSQQPPDQNPIFPPSI